MAQMLLALSALRAYVTARSLHNARQPPQSTQRLPSLSPCSSFKLGTDHQVVIKKNTSTRAMASGIGGSSWPAPLSPVFREEGALAGVNEDLALIGIGMALLAILDVTVVRWALSRKSRYFALHAAANTVATIAAFPDVLRGLTEPELSWSGPSQTMVANSAICAIHIYHCVAFK
jgi:hypothetical protein